MTRPRQVERRGTKEGRPGWRSAAGRPWRALAIATVTILAVVACGGPPSGGGGPDPFFQGRVAFGGPAPDGALIVSVEAFKALSTEEGFVWESLARRERLAAEAAARYTADRAAAASLIAGRPELAWLLYEPDASADDLERLPSGEFLLRVEGEAGAFEVTTMSHATSLREVLASAERLEDRENLRTLYGYAYAGVPVAVRTGLPAPAALADGSVAELRAALEALEAAQAAAQVGMAAHYARLQEVATGLAPVVPGAVGVASVTPFRPPGFVLDPRLEEGRGIGLDRTSNAELTPRNAPCTMSENGLAHWIWWPQQHYQTSIKEQGQRGSCVAFALASAIESNVAVRLNRWVNVSEQRLYYTIKSEWSPSLVKDGAVTADMARELSSSGRRSPLEQTWNYDPSWNRVPLAPPPGGSAARRGGGDPARRPGARVPGGDRARSAGARPRGDRDGPRRRRAGAPAGPRRGDGGRAAARAVAGPPQAGRRRGGAGRTRPRGRRPAARAERAPGPLPPRGLRPLRPPARRPGRFVRARRGRAGELRGHRPSGPKPSTSTGSSSPSMGATSRASPVSRRASPSRARWGTSPCSGGRCSTWSSSTPIAPTRTPRCPWSPRAWPSPTTSSSAAPRWRSCWPTRSSGAAA